MRRQWRNTPPPASDVKEFHNPATPLSCSSCRVNTTPKIDQQCTLECLHLFVFGQTGLWKACAHTHTHSITSSFEHLKTDLTAREDCAHVSAFIKWQLRAGKHNTDAMWPYRCELAGPKVIGRGIHTTHNWIRDAKYNHQTDSLV